MVIASKVSLSSIFIVVIQFLFGVIILQIMKHWHVSFIWTVYTYTFVVVHNVNELYVKIEMEGPCQHVQTL